MKDIVMLKKPELPENWDCEKSVNTVKTKIYKWKNLTKEIAEELWVAREKLSSPGKRTDL